MSIKQAELMAKGLLKKYGLTKYSFGWIRYEPFEIKHEQKIGYNLTIRIIPYWANAVGECQYDTRTIRLSRPFVECNPVSTMKEVMLHEIAHALEPRHGHDSVWRKKARSIGSKGVPVCENIIWPEGIDYKDI